MENGEFENCPDLPSQQTQADVLLVLTSICIAISSFGWALDERTAKVSFSESLIMHKFFTISCISLLLLITMGVHKRIRAPELLLARVRLTLQDFNMSCDERGRLILKKTQMK
eukprot:gene19267-21195_t